MEVFFVPKAWPNSTEAFPGKSSKGMSNLDAKTGMCATMVGGKTSRAKMIRVGALSFFSFCSADKNASSRSLEHWLIPIIMRVRRNSLFSWSSLGRRVVVRRRLFDCCFFFFNCASSFSCFVLVDNVVEGLCRTNEKGRTISFWKRSSTISLSTTDAGVVVISCRFLLLSGKSTTTAADSQSRTDLGGRNFRFRFGTDCCCCTCWFIVGNIAVDKKV